VRGKVTEVRPLSRANYLIWPIDQYPLKSLFLLTKLPLIAIAIPFNSLRRAINYFLILPIIILSNFNVHKHDGTTLRLLSGLMRIISNYHWRLSRSSVGTMRTLSSPTSAKSEKRTLYHYSLSCLSGDMYAFCPR